MAEVPFILTEYARRGSLKQILQSDVEISWKMKMSFVLDTARGMEFIHSSGKIHRDLKSGNLLISESWVVKIADFGTAHLCGFSEL